MTAVDVAARGLAVRALGGSEGFRQLRSRNGSSAAATVELFQRTGAVSGHPGEVYEIASAPYINVPRLTLRGNGAELRNVNTTPLDFDDKPSAAMPMGTSHMWSTARLAYHPVQSVSGPVIGLDPAAAALFSPGDLVVMHGATGYHVAAEEADVYRNYTRARVVAVGADRLELDRAIPGELQADNPVIAKAGEGLQSIAGVDYYLLFAPRLSNATIASDVGSPFTIGGVIDGVFRDLTLKGRNGIVLNGLQDCLFENIRFTAWRKICELAEGSYNTVVRGLTGVLKDGSQRRNGASDVAPFFIGIVENSAYCTLEQLDVSSGPNSSLNGVACMIATGRSNRIRRSTLRFPAHTGSGLVIQSHATPGNPTIDCGFEDVELVLPLGQQYFHIADPGAGVTRPYLRNVRCRGAVTLRAGLIAGGHAGVLENVVCDAGALQLSSATMTDWRIERCYFPGGFTGLTRTLLSRNTIRDNESDASRRIAAAAIVNEQGVAVASTTTGNVVHTMTIAPADLAQYDEVHFRWEGYAAGGGTNARHVRLTCSIDGTSHVEIAHLIESQNIGPMHVSGKILVANNAAVSVNALIQGSLGGPQRKPTVIAGGNLATKGLVLKVEIWTETAGSVIQSEVAIAGQKAGMRNVRVFP